ncbi:MAG TPA: MEDS domain-containing protein [Cyclobacteriaceae bacterium]|nr:MEDS domain-containing protein [Cyclobacteriaceae bacterium]
METFEELRTTGIDVIEKTPWGTHICSFFDTKEDLLDILVPYFRAGIEHNEYCLWITSDPITVDDASRALLASVPDLETFLANKTIEILPHAEWYLKNGEFNAKDVIQGWHDRLTDAISRGFDGMRVNGNEGWLERNVWKDFLDYERELNDHLSGLRMIVLCTYPLSKCDASIVLDVAHVHEFAMSKRKGAWEVLEVPEIKKTKAEIRRQKEQLEVLVRERTEELNQAYQNLKLAGERFLQCFHLNPFVPMALSTMDGRYIEINNTFIDLFGLTREQIEGKTVHDLNIWVNPAQRDELVSSLSNGHTVRNEVTQLRASNGRIIDMLFSMAVIPMKDGPAILSLGHDVTDQIRAERNLRDSERSLDVLINSSPGEIWLASRDLRLVKANKAFFEGVEKFTGKMISVGDPLIFPGLGEEMKSRWMALYNRVLKGELVVDMNREVGPDGEEFYRETTLSAVYDETNSVIGIGCFTNDITELIQYRNSLEEKVALRTQELQKALEKERELAQWKSRFASMVSHEFRTPLATIRLSANHIRRYKTRMSYDGIDRKLDVVREQVEHMTHLLDDVMSLGRASDLKIEITRKPIRIRPFFEGLSTKIERVFKKTHRINCSFELRHEEFKTDDALLRNIFINLLTNAIKFSPKKREVFVHVRESADAIEVEVRDQGMGIADEDLPNIFEPFHRGRNADSFPGTGLGLSIVKQATDLLGGSISVKSKPGKGSTFHVRLPIV